MMKKLSVIITLLLLSAVSLQAQKVSAYLSAPYADAKTVKGKLKKAGFQVLATYHPAGHSDLNVLVITNSKLKSLASKPKRGFAAIQRVMVDDSKKTVLATNPKYWLKAYMQKDFQAGSAKPIKASLAKALGTLTPTNDKLKAGKLSHYHFMLSMPYYEDMLDLGAKSGVKPGKKVFDLKLANGSKLIGVNLGKATESFVDKIGKDKAILLPYTVLIEDGKAYALHPKYYIALSYPLLSMGQFMKISSTPDKIERKLKKALK
jgi:hypothetical protein